MPARTTRALARERVLRTMTEALDRMIPPDESEPLRGSTLRHWEDQVAKVRQAVMPTLLEERAASPANEPELLGVGLDGGRVQEREADPQTRSRWHEDKVCTVTSYLRGDGRDETDGGRAPQKLVTTHVATMGASGAIGLLARSGCWRGWRRRGGACGRRPR